MKLGKKRGVISGEVVFMIPKLIFLTAVLFAVVILVKLFIITTTDIRRVESDILISRLLYSPNGLSYFDNELKRVYPAVIDLNKFKQLSAGSPNQLDNGAAAYGSDNPIIAAKITLKQEGSKDIDVFYNKDRFDKWEPRTLSSVEGGAGSVQSFKEQRYVLAKEGDKLSPAILDFNVIS